MNDTFVPLDRWLHAQSHPCDEVQVQAASPASHLDSGELSIDTETAPEQRERETDVDRAVDEALSEIRRFRAALADALDVMLGPLLRDIACNVLGRELTLEPEDVRTIVTRIRERACDDLPLTVRVHPQDVASLACTGLTVIADDTLRCGDAMLELRSGTIDASLGARVARVLHTYDAV